MRSIIKNKKAAEGLIINKTILIILVIVTILVVLVAWFKADILSWIKSLPGFGTAEVDDRVIDESYLASQGYTPIGIVQIQKISEASAFKEFYIKIGDKQTHLYWPVKEFTGKIMLAVPWGRDIEIGEVKAYVAGVYKWYLFDGSSYQELVSKYPKSKIPSLEELNKLDGAEYYSGTLWKKLAATAGAT